ncbi:sulfate ABC transporter ATP-binding protein [Salmonella enterica subsp. arizonae]|uniref:Sulfate ABC transporter ATP-binding protein n=1 Tax=Salmonella enterica subsp. arizonae TaxID=59203 RepID=A0A379TAE5_SALER|nr:sulfate ABC transporter ATP-binding protein [Salmonella enterica subsp. arizonae]
MSIEIARIKKSFGRTLVLNDISLDIPSGQMVALLGAVWFRQNDAAANYCRTGTSRAADIFAFTVQTSAACTRVSVKSALCFSIMRCFVI